MEPLTKINCFFFDCKYNSSCCMNPVNTECHCTLKEINILRDEDTGITECEQYEYDYTKQYECYNCQLENYGEIEVNVAPEPEYIEVDNFDDLLK